MLSCKDTTVLASHRLDEKLPWLVRGKLYLHLLMCVHCRRYVKQLQVVVATIARHVRQPLADDIIQQQTKALMQTVVEKNKH